MMQNKLLCLFLMICCGDCAPEIREALANVSYTDQIHNKTNSFKVTGIYGASALQQQMNGELMLVKSFNKTLNKYDNLGCSDYIDVVYPNGAWIALIERGICAYSKKIIIAKEHNASGVIIINDNPTGEGYGKMDVGKGKHPKCKVSRADQARIISK